MFRSEQLSSELTSCAASGPPLVRVREVLGLSSTFCYSGVKVILRDPRQQLASLVTFYFSICQFRLEKLVWPGKLSTYSESRGESFRSV